MSIILDRVNYVYNEGDIRIRHALKDINLVIGENEFIGIIGHTGSGKSTLSQIINGLLVPSSGHVYYNGQDVHEPDFDIKKLRQKAGLVFQYPEHQLFESTVFKDVCFGPEKLGLDRKASELRAFEALTLAGLDNGLFYRSPLELSGGQKRRAAIACVLAMKPEVLILDEPAAGLDPGGRKEILDMLKSLRENKKITIILITHSMNEAAEYAERIVVMNDGAMVYDGDRRSVFSKYKKLEQIGLSAPDIVYIMSALKQRGLNVDDGALTMDEGLEGVINALERKGIYRC